MDPITAINMEFTRKLQEEWTREAPTQEAQVAPQVTRVDMITRLRTTVGERLIAAGTWLKGYTSQPQTR